MILRLNIILILACLSLKGYGVDYQIVANNYTVCGVKPLTMQAIIPSVSYSLPLVIRWYHDAACTQLAGNGQLEPAFYPEQPYRSFTFTATHTANKTYYLAIYDTYHNTQIIPMPSAPKSVVTLSGDALHLDFDPATLKICGQGKATIRMASTHPPVEFEWYDSNGTTLLGKTRNDYWETPVLQTTTKTFYIWVPGYMCEKLAVTVSQVSGQQYTPSILQETVACVNSVATVRAIGMPVAVQAYWYNDAGWNVYVGGVDDYDFQTLMGTTTQNFWMTFGGSACRSQAVKFQITPQTPAVPANQTFSICPASESIIQPSGSFQSLEWYDEHDNLITRSPSLRIRGLDDKRTRVYKVAGVYGGDCTSDGKATITVNAAASCDDQMNWMETVLYDSGNTVIGNTRTYFDQIGQSIQTQTRSLSKVNTLIVSQSINDRYGRPVLKALSAPVANTSFQYDHYFVSSSATSRYGVADFDTEETLENPAPVFQAPGSLGWYYSSANTWEQNISATAFPYSRSESYNDGTGENKRTAGPGDVFRLGTGHQAISALFPVFHELDAYLKLRRIVGIGDVESDNTLQRQGVQYVTRDVNGKYTVNISDMSGNVVLAGIPGKQGDDNHVLEVVNAVTSSADIQSSDFRPMTYFYILTPQEVGIEGGGQYTIYDMVSEKPYTPTDTDGNGKGNWNVGFYRVKLSQGAITLNYKNYYQDVSVNFYNNVGRLLSSVSPTAFKIWVANRNFADVNDILLMTNDYNNSIAKTVYAYNFRGWLLEMAEPDAGATSFRYRADGSIRFSQNAEQRTQEASGIPDRGRFSFTSYDKLARPIQSGEYIGTALTYGNLSAQLELAGQDTFDLEEKRHWISTYYDFADAKFSDRTHLPAEYIQAYTYGTVSYTKNANVQTWYSYDDRGRVVWMAQKPKRLPLVFVAKYQYDFLGNIRTVSNLTYDWKAGVQNPREQFYHHYLYDGDKRLASVYTSELRYGPRKLRATYEYYLHGPLKRIELGNEVQGIDLVYNIQGWLTQINHPDQLQDPGGDANDVFGMVLDYYESSMNNLYPTASTVEPYRSHTAPGGLFETMMTHGPLLSFLPKSHAGFIGVISPFKRYSAENPMYQQMLQSRALNPANR